MDEVPLDGVDAYLDDYENGPFWQDHMQQYYGMVKCIDYNIGKLMDTLARNGIDENTIVVFTSDHGDLLNEHGKLNKGKPYETSAGIPFLIRYPDRIPAGKVIETAYSSVDFAPTILSIMGVKDAGVNFQGVDGSQELISDDMLSVNDDQIVFSFDVGNSQNWAAAIKNNYKLVVSIGDIPWLFDVGRDPLEMNNYIESSWYSDILKELQDALVTGMNDYRMPLVEFGNFIFIDKPACWDNKSILPINNGRVARCQDIGEIVPAERCINQNKVGQHCPVTCGLCCKDTVGLLWVGGSAKTCSQMTNLCSDGKVKTFCPVTCGVCDEIFS